MTLVREYWNVRKQRFDYEGARQHPSLWQESKPSRVKNSDFDSKLSNVVMMCAFRQSSPNEPRNQAVQVP